MIPLGSKSLIFNNISFRSFHLIPYYFGEMLSGCYHGRVLPARAWLALRRRFGVPATEGVSFTRALVETHRSVGHDPADGGGRG
jgi:hypothetical protein